MSNRPSKFGIMSLLRATLGTGRHRLKPPVILLLLALFGGSADARVSAQNPPARSLAPGAPFAIADFDGDLLPDLISVQTGSNNSGTTNYWIQLQLSAAGRQSVRLVGPTGGLVIVARDVNGDHAIDLVLATAWSRKPVAIFLNDGRGNFSQVESTKFPEAFGESATNWVFHLILTTDTFGVPTQPRSGACTESRSPVNASLRSDSVSRASAGFLSNPFLISNTGRAPPF
jgi:hypothetical protein